MTVGYADDIELESPRLFESLILGADLVDELSAHGAHTTDEEVENLVFGEEEGVMQHIE